MHASPRMVWMGLQCNECRWPMQAASLHLTSLSAEKTRTKAEIMDIDAGTSPIQQQRLAIAIRASYEGEIPDHATHFVQWITT